MPESTKICTRILNKHDIEVNWLRNSSFVPLQGELIIYDCEVDSDGSTLELPNNRVIPYTYERVKIGDGYTSVNDLPFFAGDYNDLTNAPIVKDNLGDLIENDSGKKIATEDYVAEQLRNISIETPGEYTSIILKSSTEGSTKKFRLTIDDDGIISTEEVVE